MRATHRPCLRLTAALVAWSGLVACVSRGAAGDRAQAAHAAAADTPPPLVGRWALASGAPPRYGPGIRLELAIDSLRSDSVLGRVTFMFSGNVGVDPARFGPLRGVLVEDSLLSLAAEPAQPDGPRLTLAGVVRGDSVRLREFRLGPDDLAGGAAQWWLVRQGR